MNPGGPAFMLRGYLEAVKYIIIRPWLWPAAVKIFIDLRKDIKPKA